MTSVAILMSTYNGEKYLYVYAPIGKTGMSLIGNFILEMMARLMVRKI